VTVIVLDRTGYYPIGHALRSLRGGTDRVPTTKCAERLATSAFDRFHDSRGREEARRDQSRRCLKPTL